MARPWFDIHEFTTTPDPMDWAPVFEKAIECLSLLSLSAYETPMMGCPEGNAGTLYLPAGTYRISRPILIGRLAGGMVVPSAFLPCSLSIVGEGSGTVPRSVIQTHYGNATPFLVPDLSAPALIIQGAQHVLLHNLRIVGENDWLAQAPPGTDPESLHYDEDPDRRIDPYLVGGARDVPASPHAGICIDPFHPDVPLRHRYPNQGRLYLPGPASKDVRIKGCLVENFVVGVALSPTGRELPGGQRSDAALSLSDVMVRTTKSAVSIGHRRKAIVQSLGVSHARHAINCIDHGGPGDCPSVFGARIRNVREIFRAGTTGASVAINHMNAERCLSLGQIGPPSPRRTSTDTTGIGPGQTLPGQTLPLPDIFLGDPRTKIPVMDAYRFNGCDFSFSNPGDLNPARPAYKAHLINRAHCSFDACCFMTNRWHPDAPVPPVHLINQGVLSFERCLFSPARFGPGQDMGPAHWISGDTGWVSYRNCALLNRRTLDEPANFTPFSDVQRAPDVYRTPHLLNPTVRAALFQSHDPIEQDVAPSLLWTPGTRATIPIGNFSRDQLRPSPDGTLALLVPAGLVQAGDVITVDAPLPYVIDAYERDAAPLLLGRVVFVTPLEGALERIELRFAPLGLSAALAASELRLIPLAIVHFPRLHPPTTGDIGTLGISTLITGVKIRASDRAGRPLLTLQDAWAEGHRIAGEGIPPGTYVKKVTANSILLSRPAVRIGVGVSLYDADVKSLSLKRLV